LEILRSFLLHLTALRAASSSAPATLNTRATRSGYRTTTNITFHDILLPPV
jgi:hypothetical protein